MPVVPPNKPPSAPTSTTGTAAATTAKRAAVSGTGANASPSSSGSSTAAATTTAKQTAAGRGPGMQGQRPTSRGSAGPSPPHGTADTPQPGQARRPPSQSSVRSNASGHDEDPSDKLTVPIGSQKGMFFDFNEKQAMLKQDLSKLKLSVRPNNPAGKK